MLPPKKVALLVLAFVVVVFSVAVVRAETSQVTAVPDHIGTNGTTSLQICRLTAPVDTITSLQVTDPSGSVWTHAASVGTSIPVCPTTHNVNFGGASAGWVSNDGDVSQTDETGQYHVQVFYADGSRGGVIFDASAFFRVPEFSLALALPVATGFAFLVGMRRLRKAA